jgi:MurNAc alpha-1-phosphate uridylyltransferase
MNTEAVWRGSNPVRTLQDAWHPDKMDALLLMIPTSNAVGHNGSGDFDIDSEGRLSRGSEYVYSGVQVIRTDGLASISLEAFSMWALWESMLANETMFGVVYDGQWCDVGRPDSIPVAEDMLAGDPNV